MKYALLKVHSQDKDNKFFYFNIENMSVEEAIDFILKENIKEYDSNEIDIISYSESVINKTFNCRVEIDPDIKRIVIKIAYIYFSNNNDISYLTSDKLYQFVLAFKEIKKNNIDIEYDSKIIDNAIDIILQSKDFEIYHTLPNIISKNSVKNYYFTLIDCLDEYILLINMY